MASGIQLQELSPPESEELFAMIREIGKGENGFVNGLYCENMDLFQSLVQSNSEISLGKNLKEGYVPQTLYWLFIDGRPVGYGKLRHRLNEKLLVHGGHIGYVIRPSERGKGYGKILLQELLDQAKAKMLDQVLITCNEENVASRKIAESSGGKLDHVLSGSCSYWIKLI